MADVPPRKRQKASEMFAVCFRLPTKPFILKNTSVFDPRHDINRKRCFGVMHSTIRKKVRRKELLFFYLACLLGLGLAVIPSLSGRDCCETNWPTAGHSQSLATTQRRGERWLATHSVPQCAMYHVRYVLYSVGTGR